MKVCINHPITFYFYDDEKFCYKCGHTLTEGEFPCPKCKKVINMNNNFCEWCGANLTEKEKTNLDEIVDKIKDEVEKLKEETHYGEPLDSELATE